MTNRIGHGRTLPNRQMSQAAAKQHEDLQSLLKIVKHGGRCSDEVSVTEQHGARRPRPRSGVRSGRVSLVSGILAAIAGAAVLVAPIASHPAQAVADYRAMTEPASDAAPSPKKDVVVVDDLRTPFDPELLTSRPGWGYALIAAALLIGIVSINRYNSGDGTKAAATKVDARGGAGPGRGRLPHRRHQGRGGGPLR